MKTNVSTPSVLRPALESLFALTLEHAAAPAAAWKSTERGCKAFKGVGMERAGWWRFIAAVADERCGGAKIVSIYCYSNKYMLTLTFN